MDTPFLGAVHGHGNRAYCGLLARVGYIGAIKPSVGELALA
jgi:hypothetical protein